MNHPALDGTVIDLEATFLHDLFDIAVAQCVRQIPPDALEYHLSLEEPPLKVDHESTVAA